MRLEVTIPDQLVGEAQRVAGEIGVSFDRFLTDAVQLHLHDELDEPEKIRLTPEQVAIIRRSQAEIREGKGLTTEQVEASLALKKAAWLKATH